jgi:hypothetical protein
MLLTIVVAQAMWQLQGKCSGIDEGKCSGIETVYLQCALMPSYLLHSV